MSGCMCMHANTQIKRSAKKGLDVWINFREWKPQPQDSEDMLLYSIKQYIKLFLNQSIQGRA